MEPISFTAHNIELENGEYTKPEMGGDVSQYPWFVAARRVLSLVLRGDKSRFSLVDLGCLEGGYTVEFARMGFQSLGLEVREGNFAACQYVKERILQSLQSVGFDLIFEQFDGLQPDIVRAMTTGEYRTEDRSTFVGVRTAQL